MRRSGWIATTPEAVDRSRGTVSEVACEFQNGACRCGASAPAGRDLHGAPRIGGPAVNVR